MRRPAIFLAVSFAAVAASGAAMAEPAFCSQLRAELASIPASAAPRRGPDCSAYGLFGRPAGCPGLLGRIFGGGGGFLGDANNRRRADLKMALTRSGCDSISAGAGGGSVRTLCVRTCDGYYFPIGNSSSRKRINADEKACQAMYPGGGAELYTQRYSGSPDADASIVSLKGKAYSSEPFAFRYREAYDANCVATFRPDARTAAATPVPISPTALLTTPDAADLSGPLPRAVRIVGSDEFYALPEEDRGNGAGHPDHHPLHFSGLEPDATAATR